MANRVHPNDLVEQVRSDLARRRRSLVRDVPTDAPPSLQAVGRATIDTSNTSEMGNPGGREDLANAPDIHGLADELIMRDAPAEPPGTEGSSPQQQAQYVRRTKPRFARARNAIDRAASKNRAADGWPVGLAALRRNQGAVNDALIRAVEALLETSEWLHQKVAALESRCDEHGGAIAEARRRLENQELAVAELDRLRRNTDDLRAELDALHRSSDDQRAALNRRLHDTSRKIDLHARQATEDEQRLDLQRRQLATLQRELGTIRELLQQFAVTAISPIDGINASSDSHPQRGQRSAAE